MSTKLPTYEGTLEGLGRIMVYCHEHFGKADNKEQKELTDLNKTAKDAVFMLQNYNMVFQPMKPVRNGNMWECAVCHSPVGIFNDDEWDDYCRHCGKAVLWCESADSL